MARSQIARARGSYRMPVDTAMFIKAPIFQGHRDTRQPRTHFLERDRELSARFRMPLRFGADLPRVGDAQQGAAVLADVEAGGQPRPHPVVGEDVRGDEGVEHGSFGGRARAEEQLATASGRRAP